MFQDLLEAIERLKNAASGDLGDEYKNFVNDAFKVLPIAFPWFVPPRFETVQAFDEWLDELKADATDPEPPPLAA